MDTLRGFLRGAAIPGNATRSYASQLTLTSAQISHARTTPSLIRTSLSPRPILSVQAVVTEDSFADPVPVLTRLDNGLPLCLFDNAGYPFPFPRGLPLLPGTQISVMAYNDRTNFPYEPDSAVEVIGVSLISLPVPAASDADQNAMDDAWELFFFNTTGIDPFGDADGDGYTNLQEFLAGSDPLSAASTPAQSPWPVGPPVVQLVRIAPDLLEARIQFPTAYSGQLGFRLQVNDRLDTPFTETVQTAQPSGHDTYAIQIPAPDSALPSFIRFRLFLK